VVRQGYTAEQEQIIRRDWGRDGAAVCPVCRETLTGRPVPRPSAVSYVRRRSWLTCPGCRRTVVADDPRTGRGLA
jgi:hypothetical protein